jgi:uncharacterized membrane protein
MKKNRRKIRRADIAAIIVSAILLVILWVKFIDLFISKNYFGYFNYYGQPVGIFLLLVMLVVITPLFFIIAWRTINRGNKNQYNTPQWMQKPPFKFPWQ